jgi:H+/Cl- antiporter ClcA
VSGLSPYLFFYVSLLALLAGLAGSSMAKIILILIRWKQSFRFQWQHILYISVCALLIASMACFISLSALGSGKELMTHALFSADKYNSWYMPLVRMAGSVFSFTSGAAGGVFAPALSAGASIGSLFASLFRMSQPDTNLLILAGMVAFLTGVTRTPFTSAILVLEMTDRHNVIFFLMLAGMLSSLAAMLVDKRSFYDHMKMQYLRELRVPENPVHTRVPEIQP